MTKHQTQCTITAHGGLDTQTLQQAQSLAAEVLGADGIALKIDWEFAAEGAAPFWSSFCCYAGEQLVGYALLEREGPELEVTAAVAPAFRRQGILTKLLEAAAIEARRRGARELLGVGYRASASGTAAVSALGLPYAFSEYSMEADAAALPVLETGQVTLEAVAVTDAPALAQTLTATFEQDKYPVDALAERLQAPNARYFFAAVEGTCIGQIGVIDTGDSIYIRGVGILPEYRRQGYGRRLLAALLKQMLGEGHTRFVLDVATKNPSALSIYRACGFQQTSVYDYYTISLADAP